MANNPIFRISAAVVKQLGEELVSDELTAIMELVKNSYDADADWVKITINTEESLVENDLTFPDKKGYIAIEDNGDGMDYNDIISKWLFISVSHKREMKAKGETTHKKRTPLGDKGLGRLSTQRLGSTFEIFTGKKGEKLLHHVAFDWQDFKEDNSLENVNTNYTSSQKDLDKKGTKLIVTDLKDAAIWAGEAGNKFRAELSKLIFPFKETRPFSIYLNINGQNIDLDEISDKLRSLAISSYKVEFDENELIIKGALKLAKLQGNSSDKREQFNRLVLSDDGRNFFDFLSSSLDNRKYFIPGLEYVGTGGVFFTFEKRYSFGKDFKLFNIVDETTSKLMPANPGRFYAEIDEFNLSGTDEIESAYDKLSEYKQLVKNQTGVRIFRDGFGIKPYGMGNDDWLKLSKSQTSGGSFYLLRPENVIGFVSITADVNKNLTEKTDREGFVENPYSKNFFSLIEKSIIYINDILDKTRRSYDELKRTEAQATGGIKSFKDTKDRLIATAKQSNSIESETEDVQNHIQTTAAKVSAAIYKIKSEPLFTSDAEQKSLQILEEVEDMLAVTKKLFTSINFILENAKKLESDANFLEPKINELENQIIQFSELAGLGITAEAFTHEIYNIIDKIGNQTTQTLKAIPKGSQGNATFFVYIEQVKEFIVSIRRQLNHLAPSLKFNRETKQEVRISSFIKEQEEYYHMKNEGKISFKIEVENDFVVLANKGKLTQILDNLLLNSEYWVNKIAETDHTFLPQIEVKIKSPSIYVSDNGYGIPPALEDTLFQPFVTSKPKGEGRGLGLFVVQQLIESLDGNIILLNKRNTYSRRFIFQINLENISI